MALTEQGRFSLDIIDELGRSVFAGITETGSSVFPSGPITASMAANLDVSAHITASNLSIYDCTAPLNVSLAASITVYQSTTSSAPLALWPDYVSGYLSAPLSVWPDYVVSMLSAGLVISEIHKSTQSAPVAFPLLSTSMNPLDMCLPTAASSAARLSVQSDYCTASISARLNQSVPVNSVCSATLQLSAPAVALLSSTLFAGDTLGTISSAPLSLPETGAIVSTMSAPLDMGLQSVIRPAPVYSIVAGGADISDLITGLSISQSRSAAHYDFNFSSFSPELFNALSPGDALTITLDSVIMQFLIEELKAAGDLLFNVWGRSASCLLDTPHAAQITLETDGSQSAAELALVIAGVTSWDAVDYPLPDGWSMTGTPLEIVARLAATVGAVVQPDGSGIKVVRRYPARPVDWDSAAPVASYSREQNILSLSWDDEARTPWNSVQVTGRTQPWQAPLLELEEDNPAPGDTVHVRVFRKGQTEVDFESMVTDGGVIRLGGTYLQTVSDELVQFSEYRAALRYPADDIIEFSWIGDDRGSIYWLDGGRSAELELAPEGEDLHGFGLASITYKTSYERYRLAGHNVPELLLILAQPDNQAVRVRISVNGTQEPAAAALTDELATTPAAAVARGTAWLDNNRYNQRHITLSAPHAAVALPGALVSLADEIEGVSGTAMVERRTISISGPAVVDSLEVVQCPRS